MRNTVWDDFRMHVLYSRNTLNQLMAMNISVFIILGLLWVLQMLLSISTPLQQAVVNWLALPGSPIRLFMRPWTIITYQFVHAGIFHLVFNMIVLSFAGRIFREFLGDKKLLSTYLIGGIAGGIFYLLAVNLFPMFGGTNYTLIGASASIMALLVAVATLLPRYTVYLILIGPVQLVYIALVLILVFILSLAGQNAGGQFAHLGGALWGFIYIQAMNRGRDLGKWMTALIDWIAGVFRARPAMRPSYRNENFVPRPQPRHEKKHKVTQEEVDAILDKIARSGYESLSSNEKETLFKASKDN